MNKPKVRYEEGVPEEEESAPWHPKNLPNNKSVEFYDPYPEEVEETARRSQRVRHNKPNYVFEDEPEEQEYEGEYGSPYKGEGKGKEIGRPKSKATGKGKGKEKAPQKSKEKELSLLLTETPSSPAKSKSKRTLPPDNDMYYTHTLDAGDSFFMFHDRKDTLLHSLTAGFVAEDVAMSTSDIGLGTSEDMKELETTELCVVNLKRPLTMLVIRDQGEVKGADVLMCVMLSNKENADRTYASTHIQRLFEEAQRGPNSKMYRAERKRIAELVERLSTLTPNTSATLMRHTC